MWFLLLIYSPLAASFDVAFVPVARTFLELVLEGIAGSSSCQLVVLLLMTPSQKHRNIAITLYHQICPLSQAGFPRKTSMYM